MTRFDEKSKQTQEKDAIEDSTIEIYSIYSQLSIYDKYAKKFKWENSQFVLQIENYVNMGTFFAEWQSTKYKTIDYPKNYNIFN